MMSLISPEVWAGLAILGAALAGLVGAYFKGKGDGKAGAIVNAAKDEQRARERADAAAADAGRDGAAERLRTGRF